MSESIESFWKEYESLATEFGDSETSSTLAPWIVREQVNTVVATMTFTGVNPQYLPQILL